MNIKFSKTSLSRLETCDVRLISLFSEIIKNFDCIIICGHRGAQAQEKAYREGKSKLRYPYSKHNIYPSLAVDAGPWYPRGKIRWKDIDGFIHFAGYVRGVADTMGLNIRWGGDWNKNFDLLDEDFQDFPHFELID